MAERKIANRTATPSSSRENTATFETVEEIALKFPGVERSTTFGSPALKINGKLLACIPAHRSAEPDSFVIRLDIEDRDELLVADPGVYYVTDHYVGYSSVLVRLSRISPDALRDLVGMAYKFVTRKPAPRSRSRNNV